jgi:hypothetical protein
VWHTCRVILTAHASIDHHLVARVQGRITGENAHEVHAALGVYLATCDLERTDPSLEGFRETMERRLRAFCYSGKLSKASAA